MISKITLTLEELKTLMEKYEKRINAGCDLAEKETGLEIPQEKRLLMRVTFHIEKDKSKEWRIINE
jgi:hypothetical protein